MLATDATEIQEMTAGQRHKQEKADRQRRKAQANAEARERATGPFPIMPIGRSIMTPREQYVMQQIVKPLHDEGVIDHRYMGIRFLELFVLGWTPMRYVMIGDTARRVGLWMSDSDFECVWNWWNWLHYETRNKVCVGAARRFLSVDNGYRGRA